MNDYHLAIATALPTEYDSNWKKSSSPNPNLPGPSPCSPPRQGRRCMAAWGGCGAGLGRGSSSGPTGPSAPLPTQRQGSSKKTCPSSSTSPDRPRQVGKEQVMEGEASRLTCSQVSTMCFPPPPGGRTPDRGTQPGDVLGYSAPLLSDATARAVPCPPQRGPAGGCGALRAGGTAGGRGSAEMRRVPAAPGTGGRVAASSLAANW